MTGAVLIGPAARAIQDSKVSPGVLGFLVVAALGVATWLLVRSMNRQIHKISFAEDAIDVARETPSVPEPGVASAAGAGETVPDGSAHSGSDGDNGSVPGSSQPPG